MKVKYIGLLRKEPGSDYGVSFPDAPGCITAGSTIAEARRMAQEALTLHLQGMAKDGEVLPEPSSLKLIIADPANNNAVAFPVRVRIDRKNAEVPNETTVAAMEEARQIVNTRERR